MYLGIGKVGHEVNNKIKYLDFFCDDKFTS